MCDSTQGSFLSKSHENTSKYVDTVTFFQKLEPKVISPRWPLTSHLLRSHVWLYPRIIVSKSRLNTSLYVDTVINCAKYHIHTTYRMSYHIVSFWTKFRRDKKGPLVNLWGQKRHPVWAAHPVAQQAWGEAGGRVPPTPETSDREISADLPGKKRQGKSERGGKWRRKKGKLGNWKWKEEKLENEERTFFFFFFLLSTFQNH